MPHRHARTALLGLTAVSVCVLLYVGSRPGLWAVEDAVLPAVDVRQDTSGRVAPTAEPAPRRPPVRAPYVELPPGYDEWVEHEEQNATALPARAPKVFEQRKKWVATCDRIKHKHPQERFLLPILPFGPSNQYMGFIESVRDRQRDAHARGL